MSLQQIKIKRTKIGFEDLPLPKYSTDGSAGMDLYAAINESVSIAAGKVALIPTGLSIELLPGLEAQVRSRSGLALKNGIFCLNSPGTIDSDYRGEIGVIIANFSDTTFTINRGDRIAQMVIAHYIQIDWSLQDDLSDSTRGAGGFGSTGV